MVTGPSLRYAARSDPGMVRRTNQDSLYASQRLLAVADGIGGGTAGDVASSIVIGTVTAADRDVPQDQVLDKLRAQVRAADRRLREAMSDDRSLRGMGTTLTALLFSGEVAGLAHIGDSRAYLLRGGELAQITRDDSYVQLLVDEGRITADEASRHPYRSVVTKAMQGSAPEAGYEVLRVLPGDRFLLCSDGLSDVVPAGSLAAAMTEYPDPRHCVDRLVEVALQAGGPDNITVIVADVLDGPVPEQAPVVSIAADRPDLLPPGVPTAGPGATPAAGVAPHAAGPAGPWRLPLLVTVVLLVALALIGGALWL